jgi:hypothetical protein
MTSTEDCKNFIVDFVKTNPSVVISIYGEEIDGLISDATNPKKWKRTYKCKPGGGNHEFDSYEIFSKNVKISRMGYGGTKTCPATEFVSERGFILDDEKYDTGIQFVVVESRNGSLHLGNYIGD